MFNSAPSTLMTRSSLILALLISLLMYTSARGHSGSVDEKLMPQTIISGEVLTKQPSELHIPFRMPIRIISIRLTDSSGEGLDVVNKSGRASTGMFVFSPPPLKNGIYSLEYRGLSRDGHPLSEKREFEVKIDN